MGYNTGLRTALDTYTYWSTPKSQYVTLLVLTQGVDVGFGVNVGNSDAVAAMFPPIDEYFPPGSLLRPEQFDAVRIKNHVAGSAAQYSLATRLSDDLPEGVPLGASFAPNYQTVNADGTVGALFTGGVQLLEYLFPIQAPLFDPANNALTWQNAAGSPIGQVVTERAAAGGPDTVLLRSFYDPAAGIPHNQIKVQIVNANTPRTAVITRQLIDEAGISDFWQTRPPSVQAAWTIAGPYSSPFTNVPAGGNSTATPIHNLNWPTSAQFVFFSVSNVNFTPSWTVVDANSFTITVRNSAATVQSGTVYYMIMGHGNPFP